MREHTDRPNLGPLICYVQLINFALDKIYLFDGLSCSLLSRTAPVESWTHCCEWIRMRCAKKSTPPVYKMHSQVFLQRHVMSADLYPFLFATDFSFRVFGQGMSAPMRKLFQAPDTSLPWDITMRTGVIYILSVYLIIPVSRISDHKSREIWMECGLRKRRNGAIIIYITDFNLKLKLFFNSAPKTRCRVFFAMKLPYYSPALQWNRMFPHAGRLMP